MKTKFKNYRLMLLFYSVADPGCLSQIPEPVSEFFPSRILIKK
jgi:hypothetical protein